MDLVLISISQSAATKPERWHSDRVQALRERRVVLAAFFLSLAGARVGVWLSFPGLKVS